MLAACGESNFTTTTDARGDGSTVTSIESLPISEEKKLPVSSKVDVVIDNRGMPHIYGSNAKDVILVEGYIMARDRFGQMEFLRRAVLGRLSEVVGSLDFDGAILKNDRDARIAGYGRQGRAIYNTLGNDALTKIQVDAFVQGVNIYIDEIKASIAAGNLSAYLPSAGRDVLSAIYTAPDFERWEPADVIALARYQAASLAFDAESDISRTQMLIRSQQAFGGGKGANPLWGAFADLTSELPARRSYTANGFPNLGMDTGTRALIPRRPARTPQLHLKEQQLQRAKDFAHNTEKLFHMLGDESRGSNSWVVGKSMTGTSPMLANDPHLSLISPPVWYYVHLNTTKHTGNQDGLDVAGVAFAALPGVVLGFNRNIAWGATVVGYDVTDVYAEQLVEGGPNGSVLFNGNPVAITTITETIKRRGTSDEVLTLEVVPHHGIIIPGTRDDKSGTALSVKYTGDAVSDELRYFFELGTAKNIQEAMIAQNHFRVGGQNIVYADKDGIAWSTEVRVPVRDPRARTLQIGTNGVVTGTCPTFVLPGTGEYEWTGDLEDRYIPHAINPTEGFIATANQDSIGVTEDGNPCNDPHYLGGGFNKGHRQYRILERLNALKARGSVTAEDMKVLQAETKSAVGEKLQDAFSDACEHVIHELSDPGHHPELADILRPYRGNTAKIQLLANACDAMTEWTLATPHGVGATEVAAINDSVGTTVFNLMLTRALPLLVQDEYDLINAGHTSPILPTDDTILSVFERAVTEPNTMYTYDASRRDTVLWDDVSTSNIEIRIQQLAKAFVSGVDWLESNLGADANSWRWGRLHTVRFTSLIPLGDALSIPTPTDTMFPNGFPRNGDYGVVDVGNFKLYGSSSPVDFQHKSGATQRLVVEMTPSGPVAYNALPGGQHLDPASLHHADEAQLWIKNEAPRVAFNETEVIANFERRIVINP